jgi:NAD(P)-dependent dehydrogenase (short-subunit alcohol dehydrogenase family)
MPWSVGAGLAGRGVVVTGAAGGIGSAVTKGFAQAGARVAAIDRDVGHVRSVLAECEGTGHAAMGTDLADVRRHQELIGWARAQLGEVFALAHVAAVLIRRPDIGAVTEEDWDVQIDTNLKAAFFLCRAAAEAMVEQESGGRIITLASQGWWTGGVPGSAPYAASKAGVVSLSRNLARAYGPHGITVNSVAPGQIRTPLLFTGTDPALIEASAEETPLKMIGEPQDVAGPVVFLASEHARFISGATLNVSGGLVMY